MECRVAAEAVTVVMCAMGVGQIDQHHAHRKLTPDTHADLLYANGPLRSGAPPIESPCRILGFADTKRMYSARCSAGLRLATLEGRKNGKAPLP